MEKNELTNTIHTTLCPRAVLIAYTYAQDKKYFLEQRSIDAKGRMGEGRPVTVEFMNELVRNYSETYSGTPYGRLPSNLLYADTRKGSEEYIWYNPPGKRMMYFVENLGIENAQYNPPSGFRKRKIGHTSWSAKVARNVRGSPATMSSTVVPHPLTACHIPPMFSLHPLK